MPDYLIVLESSDTGYAAFSPDVPGCIATGRSVEEALAEMRSALIFHFEDMSETGETLPVARGFEHHLHSDEYSFEAGDLWTTISADELRGKLPIPVPAKI